MKKLSTIFVVVLSLAVGGCDSESRVMDVQLEQHSQTSTEALWGFWDWVSWWFGFDSAETETETEDVDTNPHVEERLSHVGEAVLERLRDLHPAQETSLWSLRGDAVWRDDSLIQTPNSWGLPSNELPVARTCTEGAGCDVDIGLYRCESQVDCLDVGGICSELEASKKSDLTKAKRYCTGHSDDFVDQLYSLVIKAKSQVDISTLTVPDGRFLVALRNALTVLDQRGDAVRFRLIVGDVPGALFNAESLVSELTRDLTGDTRLTVHVGGYRVGADSWNHTKIIAIDGKEVFTGGHNLWAQHYLQEAPVHDVSVVLESSVAADAHTYLDVLWDYTCEDYWAGSSTHRAVYPAWKDDCPGSFELNVEDNNAGFPVFSLGRLGRMGENPADDAIDAIMDGAQSSLKLSLQDLGPIRLGALTLSGWPDGTLESLVDAVLRGVKVDVVLSSPNSIPGGLNGASANYGNGWTIEETKTIVLQWVVDRLSDYSPYPNVVERVQENLSFAALRFSEDGSWEAGENIGNHAKFLIADEQAAYIGSQNLYVAQLAEHGILIDDASTVSRIIESYWEPLWRWSKATVR